MSTRFFCQLHAIQLFAQIYFSKSLNYFYAKIRAPKFVLAYKAKQEETQHKKKKVNVLWRAIVVWVIAMMVIVQTLYLLYAHCIVVVFFLFLYFSCFCFYFLFYFLIGERVVFRYSSSLISR